MGGLFGGTTRASDVKGRLDSAPRGGLFGGTTRASDVRPQRPSTTAPHIDLTMHRQSWHAVRLLSEKGRSKQRGCRFSFSEDRRFDVLRVDIKTTERNPTLQLGRAPKAWMSHTVVHVLFWQAFQQQRSIERLVFFGFHVRVRVTQVGLRDVFGKFCWTLLSVHHRPRSGGATGFADLG